MRTFVYVGLIFLILVMIFQATNAQSKEPETYLKVYAGFSDLKPKFNGQLPGVEGGVSATLLSFGRFRLEGAASVARHFQEHGDNTQALAGPQLSVDLAAGKITAFARQQFGTTYVFDRHVFTTSLGGGLDLITANRFGAGAGVRF